MHRVQCIVALHVCKFTLTINVTSECLYAGPEASQVDNYQDVSCAALQFRITVPTR